MTWTLTFPQPAERLSMNDRLHWAAKAKRVASWRQAAFYATYCHMRDQAFLHESPGPAFIRVTFPVRDNRRRDADNPAPTVKAIVDGLVDAGIWPDDTPEYVETLDSRFAKGAEMVVVEIIPRESMIVLSSDDYDAFVEALDAPAKDRPRLRRLLTQPTILDEHGGAA